MQMQVRSECAVVFEIANERTSTLPYGDVLATISCICIMYTI